MQTARTDSSTSSPSEPETVESSVGDPGLSSPAALQEVYEAATSTHDAHLNGITHLPDSTFSEQELKDIFSGAPHFLLERGRHSFWYPHILFPWDDNTSIQNLRDRRPLSHDSHSLATLHAHLPVPSRNRGGQEGVEYDEYDTPERLKFVQPAFDLGVFEVPNMLSSRAKEPACIGFRNYLELPVSHAFTYRPFTQGKMSRDIFPHNLSSRPNEPYSYCRPRTMIERGDLIKEGPIAWKRLGIRICSFKSIAERLEKLANVRIDVMNKYAASSILDHETVSQLNDELFGRFLFPMPKEMREYVPAEPGSLKYQIVVLMQVLLVKGAWVDFSLVEWRIRTGQVLWEIPPHQDGDCCLNSLDTADEEDLERKWLLFQILLTAELILRVDAAVKIGVLGKSKSLAISPHDIYYMNELRTHQIDWSIIMARRAAENLTFSYSENATGISDELETPNVPKSRAARFKQRFSRSRSKQRIVRPSSDSAWCCHLFPRYPMRQLEGLFVFAEALDWPDLDQLRKVMKAKVTAAMTNRETMIKAFDSPIKTTPLSDTQPRPENDDTSRNSLSSRLLYLQTPPEDISSRQFYLGGWPSRSWLSGFVLPGESTNHLLMATLLENDPRALRKLGPIANLYGGFVYQNQSWWSKACIVGRVLGVFAPRSICMGWVASKVVPRNEDGERISEGWFEVQLKDDHSPRGEPRIHQGSRILLESSPLGAEGDLTPRAFSLPIDKCDVECLATAIQFKQLTLAKHPEDHHQEESRARSPLKTFAFATFTVQSRSSRLEKVTFQLAFNVQFISSYTCLPPPGYIAHFCAPETAPQAEPRYHQHAHPWVTDETMNDGDYGEPEMLARKIGPNSRPRLPGHPLHSTSYPYSYIPLSKLCKMPTLQNIQSRSTFMRAPEEYLRFIDPNRPRRRSRIKETYIIDARGNMDKEAYARAWCSAVGTDAVVARVARTCIACAIREARAADVPVVIRVGRMYCDGGLRDSYQRQIPS